MPSYDESKNELVTLLVQTADMIGGEWTVGTHEGDESCNFKDGEAGRSFAAWRTAPPVSDPEAAAEEVQVLWKEAGYEVTTRFTPNPDVYEVIADGPDNFGAIFGASSEATILRGASACVAAE